MKNILQICANLQSVLGSDLINTTGLVEINLVLSAAFTKATHSVLCTQCHLLARFGIVGIGGRIVATLFSTSKSCTENTDSQNTKKHKCPLIAIAIAGKMSSFYSVIYGFSNTNNLTTERKKLEMKLDESGQKMDKSG